MRLGGNRTPEPVSVVGLTFSAGDGLLGECVYGRQPGDARLRGTGESLGDALLSMHVASSLASLSRHREFCVRKTREKPGNQGQAMRFRDSAPPPSLLLANRLARAGQFSSLARTALPVPDFPDFSAPRENAGQALRLWGRSSDPQISLATSSKARKEHRLVVQRCVWCEKTGEGYIN